MFGIGNLLGSVAGGLLDKVGLGKIAPFVKLGLNALTGNWAGVAKDVFSLVSNFKTNFAGKTDIKNPLGAFSKTPAQTNARFDNKGDAGFGETEKTGLNKERLSGLFKGLSKLFKAIGSLANGGDLMKGLGKIFSAFSAIQESMSNNQMFNDRSKAAQYGTMIA